MSFPPPLRRQSGLINVLYDIKNEASPLDRYKDARGTLPPHNQTVDGWNGKDFIPCKYNHIKKIWISDDDKQILDIQMWDVKK